MYRLNNIGGSLVGEVIARKGAKVKIKELIKILARNFENESYYWGYFFISIMLKCLYFQYTTQISRPPAFSVENVAMYIATVCVIAIIASIIIIVFNNNRFASLTVNTY